jgi:hypothetical protein
MNQQQREVVQQAFKTLDAIHKHGDIACVMTEEGEFYLAPAIAALRQLLEQPAAWVGLEKADMPDGDDPMYDHDYFIKGMVWADIKLREKNGY